MNIIEKFGRILIPMITPFKEDYGIDYALARRVARYLVDKRYCDSLIVAGTNGEFYTMSSEEKIHLFAEVKAEIGNEVPLIAGTGCASTVETVRLTQEAERLGYDAAMAVVPYFSHPTQEGLYVHFAEICRNTDLPIMIYNIPLFTGSNLEPATLSRLAEFGNLVAIKDEAGVNPLQTSAYIAATGGKVAVYSGDDLMVLAVLSQGGVGVVSGGSHVIGDLMRQLIQDFLNGKIERTTESFQRLYQLFISFFGRNKRLTNPLPSVKAALEICSGLPVSRTRPPVLGLEEDEIENLKQALNMAGKLPA